MQEPEAGELHARPMAVTSTVAVWDVICCGRTRHESEEETVDSTHLVFPYRGIYVHHVGHAHSVTEPNHVALLNGDEHYRVSHPVEGGDAALSIGVDTPTLLEMTPAEHLRKSGRAIFKPLRLPIDPQSQARVAMLRHSLDTGRMNVLEAETLTLTLIRGALGERRSPSLGKPGQSQKMVDKAKLVVSSDLGRRWTLAEIADEVGASPVYLTGIFHRVAGMPLSRYQRRLRLARALHLLRDYEHVTDLALDLGFSSHSHFSSAFKEAYGRSPSDFQRTVGLR
jgi:AraC-like DNA-binding protein